MIPQKCKRLAEVDFPIAVVSKHSSREKSIRHGHPSTLHLWWARRPLAACRAMLMALLLPDPCDPLCPREFKAKAKEVILRVPGLNTPRTKQLVKSDEGLRKTILHFIGDLADWDNSANTDYLSVARALVQAAHPDETPLVVDPFAGGGSIPLEALRLGCEAFASDLNPVACLILKVMLEDIPRHGPELADELRRVGVEIKKQAEKELAEFYPKDSDGATPIAYLWARTVKCESPNCGAEIPLMRSFWLCKKAGRKRALKLQVIRPDIGPPQVELEMFEPTADKDVHGGTVTRAKATCPCCNTVLSPERVRAQLSEQRGGADVVFDALGNRIGGARLLAVVALYPDVQGRNYRLPEKRDYGAVFRANDCLKKVMNEWERSGKKGLCPVPDEPLPPIGTLGFRVQRYGMLKWGDLFTARQSLALITLQKKISNVPVGIMPLALTKVADYSSSVCTWHVPKQLVRNTFGRNALPMTWDFCEIQPVANGPGNYGGSVEWITEVIESCASSMAGQVQLADATQNPLPQESATIWFTDPPYYDAIPYSDLSDFFLVWLKRSLPNANFLHDPFDKSNPLSPKINEIVQDEIKEFHGRAKDRLFFEEKMAEAFAEGRRILREDGLGSVVFAHKTTEGWEALLGGLIRGGWTITASWPIETEMGSRIRARESAALATSVHLVCRPRPEDAPVGDWADVLRQLPNRVADWMERLQEEGIRGADLVFACIGPALEIYSRYQKVETAEGTEVKLAEYLAKVWEVVGRTALEQVLGTEEARARNGMAGVLEEDARLTALFLWTLQATNGRNGPGSGDTQDMNSGEASSDDEDDTPETKTKGYSLAFDVVRRFAQPLGIDLPKWEGRVIETKKGIVRLMAVSERTKQIFGSAGIESALDELLMPSSSGQLVLPGFEVLHSQKSRKPEGRGRKLKIEDPGAMDATATTLDRVHAAMLLQASGQSNGLRMLIKAEQDRGPDFLRLANALSALYPKNSEEKRLLDAMLLAVPR